MHDALRQLLFSTYDYHDNSGIIMMITISYYHPTLLLWVIYCIFTLLSACTYIPTVIGRKPALNSKVHLTRNSCIQVCMREHGAGAVKCSIVRSFALLHIAQFKNSHTAQRENQI